MTIPVRPAILALALSPAPALATDPPAVGTVRELPVVSVSLAVGSTDRDTKRVVYAPPPGWYVRSHKVRVSHRAGTVTYSVSTVPAGWNWTNDERAAASGRASGSVGVTLPGVVPAGGQAAGAHESAVTGRQANTSSHHVLVVDVSARAAGLCQGGAALDLTIVAEMVYLGQ
ncbi:hypothetical protein J0H58_12375 [bacterium]|nr:hypothetical protein [bacterium]